MLRALVTTAGLLIAVPAGAADAPKVADLVRQLEAGAPGERVLAAERLGDLGPAATDAIPALTRTARSARREPNEGEAESRRANRHLYDAAINALVGIGPKSVPALVELLPGEKDDNFGAVSGHIGSFGRDAAPVVPALAKLLADDNQDFRVRVAGILERLGPGAEPAIPQLLALFENPKNKDDNRWASGPLPPPPRVGAVRALVRIGPKAAPGLTDKVLPALAEELKTGEYPPGGATADVLCVLGEAGATLVPAVVTAFRKGERGLDREATARALLGLGPTGRKAFGELLTGANPEVRRELVEALDRSLWHEYFPRYHRFDAPAIDIAPFVPALVTALKDPEPEQRLAAAKVLCDRGSKVPAEARDAVFELFRDPAVKKLMKEKDGLLYPTPRLAQFGEPGFRALVALLDSDSVAVRKFAVGELRGSRKWSAAALPKLQKMAADPDTRLALDAAYTAAWMSLDPKDAALLAGRRFLRSADPEVRTGAAYRLKWLGPVGAPHADALVPLLDDKDETVVLVAAEAIHDIAPKGSVAARTLAERKLVRDEAGRFRPAPKDEPRPERRPPGVPELMASATTGDDWKRVGAALYLGDLGATAKDAVPALKKLLLDPDPDLRFAAGYALARIGGDTPALRRLLAGELERLANGRRAAWAAGLAFERLPPDFPELVPFVALWLEQRSYGPGLVAALGKYGPKAKAAVPALRKVLRGPEQPVHAYFGFERKPACEALGAIGPDARDALPELRQLLDSGDVEFAWAARDAIRKITGAK